MPPPGTIPKYARLENNVVVVEAVFSPAGSPGENWIECPGWLLTVSDWTAPQVWSRPDFLTRLEAFAPGAWQTFLDLKDTGNPVAKQVYENGWVPHTQIEQVNPKTTQMLGALTVLGVLTAEQTARVLSYEPTPA